jgi:hypothetical protein
VILRLYLLRFVHCAYSNPGAVYVSGGSMEEPMIDDYCKDLLVIMLLPIYDEPVTKDDIMFISKSSVIDKANPIINGQVSREFEDLPTGDRWIVFTDQTDTSVVWFDGGS